VRPRASSTPSNPFARPSPTSLRAAEFRPLTGTAPSYPSMPALLEEGTGERKTGPSRSWMVATLSEASFCRRQSAH